MSERKDVQIFFCLSNSLSNFSTEGLKWSMSAEWVEPDFLIGTKFKRDPEGFPACVRACFNVEFGCTRDSQIAEVLNASPGWISDVFKAPGEVESKAISNLIAPLKNLGLKRRILRAWIQERFEIDVLERIHPPLNFAKPTEKTLNRILQYMWEGQLFLAAGYAMKAAQKAQTRGIRERLFDAALLANQRSMLHGRAMHTAKLIAQSGRLHHDPWREMYGHFARAQVLLSIPNSLPSEIEPLITYLDIMYAQMGPAPHKVPFQLITRDAITRIQVLSKIIFMERRFIPLDESLLRSFIQHLQSLIQTLSKQERFTYHHLSARCHLLLGEYFLAEEHLEMGFKANRKVKKVLHAKELCATVQARIQCHKELPENAQAYLLRASRNLHKRWNLYHMQVVETDLARLESDHFESLIFEDFKKLDK